MVKMITAPSHALSAGEPFFMDEPLGDYQEFANMVRQIVGDRSLRAVQVKTGVGHTTVLNMMRGMRPKAITIRAFAEGMGVDVGPLLEAADYPIQRKSVSNAIEPAPRMGGARRECLKLLAPPGFENLPEHIFDKAAEGALPVFQAAFRNLVEAYSTQETAAQVGQDVEIDREKAVRESPDPAEGYVDTTGIAPPTAFQRAVFPGLLPKAEREKALKEREERRNQENGDNNDLDVD